MKWKRFSVGQSALGLRLVEAGTLAEEICRRMGNSGPMFFGWKKKFVVRVPDVLQRGPGLWGAIDSARRLMKLLFEDTKSGR